MYLLTDELFFSHLIALLIMFSEVPILLWSCFYQSCFLYRFRKKCFKCCLPKNKSFSSFWHSQAARKRKKKLVLIFRTLWTELKEKEKHLFKKSNSSETLNICVVFVRQTKGQKLRRRIEIVFLILRRSENWLMY